MTTLAPTSAPLSYSDYLPTLAPGVTRAPIDWKNADTIVPYLDNLKNDNFNDPAAQSCSTPPPISKSDIFSNATALADKMGAGEQCIKSSQNASAESGSSSASDERQHFKADASGHVKGQAIIASIDAGFQSSVDQGSSKTTADQAHATSMSQANYQQGCGTLMITATNMAQKQSAMQCVMNNMKQDTKTIASASATIRIETVPLTPDEVKALEKMDATSKKIMQANIDSRTTITAALIANKYPATDILNVLKPMQELQNKQEENMQKAMSVFNRDINIMNATFTVAVGTKVTAFSQLTTSAKSDLATLAASTQKDAVAQTMANDMGVSAMDPNVKSMSQRACESTSTSASSSITNLLSNMENKINSDGSIVIRTSGTINITNVTFSLNIVAELQSQSIINQAIANALSSSAQFVSDTKNQNEVVNKAAGLNDLQKAMSDTVKGAIAANQQAIVNSQNAETEQAKSYNDKVKAVTASIAGTDESLGSKVVGGIVAIVLIFLLYKYFIAKDAAPAAAPTIAAQFGRRR
jgi:hypothetical protein